MHYYLNNRFYAYTYKYKSDTFKLQNLIVLTVFVCVCFPHILFVEAMINQLWLVI